MGISEDFAAACEGLDANAETAKAICESAISQFTVLSDDEVAITIAVVIQETLKKRQGAAVVKIIKQLMPILTDVMIGL